MTVIAWDGTTLAADKKANANGIGRTVTKIFRLNADEMVAFCGNAADAMAMLWWLKAARDPAAFPELSERDSMFAWVVRRDGSIHRYEGRSLPIAYEDRAFADGAGRDYALAAMHLGYDARTAVEVACSLDCYCGNGIDTLTFEG